MRKIAHIILFTSIFVFAGCNPGADYVSYSTISIYAVDTKEIFTVLERESANIYVPIGSHSNASRNRKFSYYLMHTILDKGGQYQNEVSELISARETPVTLLDIDQAIRKSVAPRLTRLYSKDPEGAEREFVWDLRESGSWFIKTIGGFTVFYNQNKSGADIDTISIFTNFKSSPVFEVGVQKKQFIDFFTSNDSGLYSTIGNISNDSLTINKLNPTTGTWSKILEYDLRTFGPLGHFDWTNKLLPSYVKIVDQNIEEVRIYEFGDPDLHKTFRMGRFFNNTDMTYELDTDEIKKKIELSAKASH